jgi:ParB-like chromosome segregation protein Spo0J
MNDYPWSRGEPPHEGQEPPPPRDRPPFHPLAAHLPMMDEDSVEFKGLVDSIRENGLCEPIILYQGMILDGRNRHRACRLAGVEPRFETFEETEMTPLEFVFAKNLHRRHLTVGQRALLAAEMVTTTHGDARRFKQGKDNDFSDITAKSSREALGGDKVTIADAATMWSVSPSSVERAGNVIAKAAPSIVAQVRSGKTELGLAVTMANKTPEEQHAHPLVKYARRTPSQRPAARPVTVPALRSLTDEQFLAIVIRDLPRLNRAAAREGKRIIIEDLNETGTF